MKKVAIVVLHYSGIENTKECIASILKARNIEFKKHIVVVDNGSKDEVEISKIKDQPAQKQTIQLIRSERNLGYSGGNNLGIQYALDQGFDYVLILNNDTVIDKKCIEELVSVAEGDECVGIVSPKIYFVKGFEFHKNRYAEKDLGKIIWYAGGIMDWKNVIGFHRGVDEVDHGQYNVVSQTDFASGCCMFLTRTVLEKVGLFDDRYFLYYEDSDLCERVKRHGFTIIYSPKSILWHKNAGSAGGSGSALQDYFITRNRLLFGFSYAQLRSQIALARESLTILFSGRKWQKQGVLDFYLRRFRKGSFAI